MKEFKRNIRFTMPYFKGHGFRMFLIVIFTIVILGLRILTPILSAKVIVGLTENLLDQVIILALALYATDVVWNICWYFQRQLYQKIYTDVFSKVQNALGSAILRLNNDTLDANSSGVFIQRLTGDTSNIANAFDRFLSEISGIFTSIGTLVAIFVVSIHAGIYTVVALSVSIGISYWRVKVYNSAGFKTEDTIGFWYKKI
jgi:ABC-type multidrug transport system fused ATPase/permease subunit